MSPDGEKLDVYLLIVNEPVSKYTGKVVAVVHPIDNNDDKLVVIPKTETITDQEIEAPNRISKKNTLSTLLSGNKADLQFY